MKTGSLFSGIGGIEIGFEKQGFETEWFIESEPYAQAILRKRFPQAKIYGDIKKVNFRTIPRVEILTGGFPCQDISYAGKGVGIKGSRSSLWKHYLRAISEIRPRIALIENVPALRSRGLDTVLCDLSSIGYDAEWYCISASTIGALHKRDRIFIFAYPNSNGNGLNNTSNNEEKEEIRGKQQGDVPSECSKIDGDRDVSNTNKEGLQGCKETRDIESNRKKGKQQLTRQSGYWKAEPKLGRVANGISNRVDRIKCLGNAVVPQVAEVFAKAIKEIIGD